jgi:hypothetical protein
VSRSIRYRYDLLILSALARSAVEAKWPVSSSRFQRCARAIPLINVLSIRVRGAGRNAPGGSSAAYCRPDSAQFGPSTDFDLIAEGGVRLPPSGIYDVTLAPNAIKCERSAADCYISLVVA